MDITVSIEAVRGLRLDILRLNNSLNIYNYLIIFRKSVLTSEPHNYAQSVHATSGGLDEDTRIAVSVSLGF
jgi:hypothetical protein